MGVQAVQKDLANSLAVRLLDSSNNPVTGVAHTTLTVIYKKQGGAWATKSVLAAEWSEGPDGRYALVFSGAELNTEGRFVFRVSAAGADTFTGDVDVVAEWASLESMMLDLLNALGTKASVESVADATKELDINVVEINSCCEELNKKIERLEAQAAILLRKLP